ncbi:hypothetical protein VTL71DRAFT_13547 [Oculimacula yallundae]|uniref:Uncharacterized protein n=1 Tax=Oculimacula yallundae TaxID=86028 RepID=A0ABR4CMB6_9HELO
MLPQEPLDPNTWDDASFADWIQSSPDVRLHSTPVSRGMSIADMLSSPLPPGPTASSTMANDISLRVADENHGGIFRSPRSDDLVALCRRNSIAGGDPSTRGKERETRKSEDSDSSTAYSFEDQGQYTIFDTNASDHDSGKYNFSDQLIERNFTDQNRRDRYSLDDQYLLSPSQSYDELISPTWGRTRHASSSSDLNYDNMEIEELMKDMEVFSDTDYERTEDDSVSSRTLFGHSCWPRSSSSKSPYFNASGKRKASPGLEMPQLKKRYLPNPLRCENPKPSSSQPLHGETCDSPCLGEQALERQYFLNPLRCERVVSLAHPLYDTERALYRCD